MTYFKNVVPILLFLLSLFPTFVFAQQTSAAGCYAINNAAFENTPKSNIAGWSGSSWGGSQAFYYQASPGFDSDFAGTIAVYTYVPNTSAKIRSEPFAVDANSQLNIRFNAKGTANKVQLQVVQLDKNSNAIAYTWINTVPLNSNSAIWSEYQNSFYALAETAFVQIEFVVKSTNTVSFDNVRLSTQANAQACSNEPILNLEQPTTPIPNSDSARSPSSLSNSELAQGVVFSRTDKDEFRWVQTINATSVGNQWISQACAQELNSTTVEGTWRDLHNIAPLFDSIADPCQTNNQSTASSNDVTQTNDPVRAEIRLTPNGFVFERTDKQEFRWVDETSSGSFGHQWISDVCAKRLGAVRKEAGNWNDLVSLAPSSQAVVPPC